MGLGTPELDVSPFPVHTTSGRTATGINAARNSKVLVINGIALFIKVDPTIRAIEASKQVPSKSPSSEREAWPTLV